jgi:hypothetical protein
MPFFFHHFVTFFLNFESTENKIGMFKILLMWIPIYCFILMRQLFFFFTMEKHMCIIKILYFFQREQAMFLAPG